MAEQTIDAWVVNGQLQHKERLTGLEGQQVQVTISTPAEPAQQAEGPAKEPEGEPPEWLNVEKEIDIRMPRQTEKLPDIRVIDRGRKPPNIVLPEE